MVFVTLNIFANEQNRGKRRRCSANFTLGPGVICIYIESIRFWFIIVTILGVGEGRWGRLAGILSPVMRPLSANIPERRKQGDNYGAGTKLVLLSPFTRRFKSRRESKNKDGRRGTRLCFRAAGDFFRRQTLRENEINLRARR